MCKTSFFLHDVLPQLAETAAQSSPSMTSLNDHALMHEEHAGTLGPVTYAVLNDDPNKEKDRESRKQRNERSSSNKYFVPYTAGRNQIPDILSLHFGHLSGVFCLPFFRRGGGGAQPAEPHRF